MIPASSLSTTTSKLLVSNEFVTFRNFAKQLSSLFPVSVQGFNKKIDEYARIFGRRFPKRTFDVGIAEQHAVTMAAAMAAEGLKPFVCIYSTFLQVRDLEGGGRERGAECRFKTRAS